MENASQPPPQPPILRALLEDVRDYALIGLDPQGIITIWSAGATHTFGYTEAESLGQSIDCIFTPEDIQADEPAAERRHAAHAGRSADRRWHIRKDGSRFWADGAISPTRGDDGAIIGFIKILRDDTTRHRLEAERARLLGSLALERARLDAILRQMPAGLAIAEAPSGRLLLHNEAAVALLGHPMLETSSANDYVHYGALHLDGRPYAPTEYPLARALAGEIVLHEEMTYRRGDGQLTTFAVSAAPVRADDGEIVAAVSTFYDIHARKQSEAELQRLYAAEQEARAAAESAILVRDTFLTIAAHELRTPLTSIHGYAQLLQRRLTPGAEVGDRERRALSTIADQVRRAHQLIESLLDVGRLQVGGGDLAREPIDLCALTDRILGELEPLLEHHTLTYQCVDEPVIVVGDPLRLEQALINLVQNAVKYSPSGGTIRVGVGREPDAAVWTVSDEGIGIPASARARLFQRFYRADNAAALPVGGLGIGLYVVHQLVTLHGGTISVESAVGTGSTFIVRLPRS